MHWPKTGGTHKYLFLFSDQMKGKDATHLERMGGEGVK